MLNEMSPYLLLGFFIAGLLKVYVPNEKFIRHIKRPDFRSVLLAALAGIPLPLCSCGVIPTGVSLYRDGASKGATVSFFTATPQTSIPSIAVSYSLLGLPFALIRLFAAFITGLTGGTITNSLEKSDKSPENNNTACCCCNSHSSAKNKIFQVLQYGFVEMMRDIGKWLAAGILFAGALAVFLPESIFLNYLNIPLLNMVIVLAIAVPTYTCSTSSIPMALVFMMKGLSPGAAFVYLMAGPATSVASMTVLGKVLGRRVFLIYLFCIIAGALLFGLVIDYLLPASWFDVEKMSNLMHAHHDGISWFKTICSITLAGLIVNAYVFRHKEKRENT